MNTTMKACYKFCTACLKLLQLKGWWVPCVSNLMSVSQKGVARTLANIYDEELCQNTWRFSAVNYCCIALHPRCFRDPGCASFKFNYGVMTGFISERIDLEPENGKKKPSSVLINIWRIGRLLNHKFDMGVPNECY